MTFRRRPRPFAEVLSVAALAIALPVIHPSAAHAESIQRISATGGDGLWLHTEPGLSTDLIAVIPEGEAITVTCFGYADAVSSPISTSNPIWLHVRTGAGEGWLSDAYVDTSWNTTDDLVAAGIPSCDSAVSQPSDEAVPSDSSSDWMPYCGPSAYIEEIQVEPWSEGQFKILVTPTGASRYDVNPWGVVEQMWYAIQDCVSGLEGALADSIWDQLECHQHFGALSFATGATYDLESWRGTFDASDWVSSNCGNELGVEPAGPIGSPISPDAGQSDLYGAYDNIG
ncbi:DUF2599 domain-containing protein [Janibacter sp. G1551]|jgi:hypothetical protein|uniref:DUF2599 domain-containing protein n=1 Tax=Janibacter sp. G1551 TaxID=3420440 RepID=UPI003D05AC9D